MKKILSVIRIMAVTVLFLLLFAFVNILVTPKYSEHLVEGGMIREYYADPSGHEIIFVGDCEVYANIDPVEMYRSSGISAYVRGSSQQLIWQSYYIVEETLKYEKPKAIVLNVNAMRYDEPVKEEYHRLTLDYMRWSPSKAGMINASMTEEENFMSYVFPVLRYHSRIFELSKEDFSYLFSKKKNTFNGHLLNLEVKPLAGLPAKRKLSNYTFGAKCYEYLDRIRELCEENDVELILMKAPSVYPFWYEEYESQIREYAEKYKLRYYNFLDVADEIGIDYTTDTYDAGIHLNHFGAVKLSRYFAEILKEELNLTSYREDNEISKKYEKIIEAYDRELYTLLNDKKGE